MFIEKWRSRMLLAALFAGWSLSLSGSAAAEESEAAGLKALAEGRFAEAEKILVPIANRHPDAAQVLLALGQAVEKQGRLDEAWGYYQAAAFAKAGDAKIPSDIKGRLRQEEAFISSLEKLRETIVRELAPLARDAKRQPEQALPVLALISRLAPERRNIEAYWDALYQSQKPPEPQMSGYRCLFNQFDFTNWEVVRGSWVVGKQTMIGEWGRIRFPERLPSYILRITYRGQIIPGEEESPSVLWVQKDPNPDHWAGASIILVGRRAGSISGILPDPKYGEAVADGEKACRLHKESPYKSDDWNEMEVSVKNHAISVKLNGKIVCESLKGALIEGWRDAERKKFPGCLEIHANGQLEIKTVFLRKVSAS